MFTNWIGYYKSTSMMRAFDFEVQFTNLDLIYTYSENGRPTSCAAEELAMRCTECPARVYHLASLIEQKFPHMNWDWNEQLLRFEEQL